MLAYLEPKSEYPRSKNIDYVAQESEYGVHEEFGYKERKNNARMEQYGNSYDKPHKYTPAELFYRAPEPDSPARQKVRDLTYIKREPEYREHENVWDSRQRYEEEREPYRNPHGDPRGYYKPKYPIKRGHARRDTENQAQRPVYDTP